MSTSTRAGRGLVAAGALAVALVIAAATANAANAPRPVLEFIGEATIPTGTMFEGTQVGGLSGIDYDRAHNFYYAISDDRSQINPARFYTLTIDLADGHLDAGDVAVNGVVTLLDENGQPFAAGTVDPESIRYSAKRGSLFWSSEGDANALIDPFVRETTLTGMFVRQLDTPAKFFPTADQSSGIRNNLAFESLSLTPGGDRILTATENALDQDGPAASVTDATPSRFLEYGVHSGLPKQEYVYVTNQVAEVPDPATDFSTNGLVELLSYAAGHYVSVERSFSTGRGNVIKVYLTDVSKATNVSGLFSIEGQTVTPATKTLLANLADYGIVPDNIEGVTFGPTLANGRRTLIFVSDNNFSSTQTTQFLAFSFKPGALFSATK